MRAITDRDRAMCRDHDFPSSESCLRFMAKPALFQVCADLGRDDGAERCKSFIPMEEATE